MFSRKQLINNINNKRWQVFVMMDNITAFFLIHYPSQWRSYAILKLQWRCYMQSEATLWFGYNWSMHCAFPRNKKD